MLLFTCIASLVLFAPLQVSSQKIVFVEKILGGICPPIFPTQFAPMTDPHINLSRDSDFREIRRSANHTLLRAKMNVYPYFLD